MIECCELSKSFPDANNKLNLLSDINLTIAQGEQVAFTGRSGSGKTTLLQLLAGLDKPCKGRILIGEFDITKSSQKQIAKFRNTHMGFIFQFHHLLAEFTALENVALPLLMAGARCKDAKEKAEQLLTEVSLSSKLHSKPSMLSGGERQRVAIARAIANEPAYVLADEPTGNLDKATAQEVLHVLQAMNKKYGTTLIIVTHDHNLASSMDKTFNLVSGNLVDNSQE